MNRKYTEFDKYVIKQIKKTFRFLENEYCFKIDSIINEASGVFIYYKNRTTAICVSLDERMGGVFIDLIRLVNNLIPERPIFYNKKQQINYYDLCNILEIRAPFLGIDHPHIDDLVFNSEREKVLRKVLKQHADALKEYASDVLNGDFSVFEELRSKKRGKYRSR